MSSNWSLKLPNLLLKKIRGSKDSTPHSQSLSSYSSSSSSSSSSGGFFSPSSPHIPLSSSTTSSHPLSYSSLSIIRPHEEDQLTRDCKEFYERRIHLTSKAEETSAGPSSLTSSGYFSLPYAHQNESGCASAAFDEGEEGAEDLLQSKIHHLRKEFLSLIEVDNQLFKQLLNLNDAIQDFKELHNIGISPGPEFLPEEFLSSNHSSSKICRSKSFLEDTKTFQRARISFPATRRNRRVHADEDEEDPNRIFYTLPSSKAAKKKLSKGDIRGGQEWRVSSSRSSASSSSSSSSSYERRSWKRYSDTNNSLDSGIHADSSGEHSDHYSSP